MAEIIDVKYNKGMIDIRLKALPSEAGSWGRSVIERATIAGEEKMYSMAPRGERLKGGEAISRYGVKGGKPFKREYPALASRVDRSKPTYRPGGAGGGGTWTGGFGVKAEKLFSGNKDYDPALLVYRGTGVPAGRDRIRAKHGSALSWFSMGDAAWANKVPSNFKSKSGVHRFFTKSVAGQKAQTAWVRDPRRVARRSVQRSVANFLRD
jgi:hypothetical protein